MCVGAEVEVSDRNVSFFFDRARGWEELTTPLLSFRRDKRFSSPKRRRNKSGRTWIQEACPLSFSQVFATGGGARDNQLCGRISR